MRTRNAKETLRLSELDARGLARAVVASLLTPVALDSERPGDRLLMLTAVPGDAMGSAGPVSLRSRGTEQSAEDLEPLFERLPAMLEPLFERVRCGEDVVVKAGGLAACLTRGPGRGDPVALDEWITDYWMGAVAG